MSTGGPAAGLPSVTAEEAHMHITDQSTPDEDDHCLVHHFIRATGRRPTADELLDLRQQPRVPRPGYVAVTGVLSRVVIREFARLIHRL
jgi:hypothetical protein